jgi:hypothetical protein
MDLRVKRDNRKRMDIQGDTERDRDIVTYKDNETEKETDKKT